MSKKTALLNAIHLELLRLAIAKSEFITGGIELWTNCYFFPQTLNVSHSKFVRNQNPKATQGWNRWYKYGGTQKKTLANGYSFCNYSRWLELMYPVCKMQEKLYRLTLSLYMLILSKKTLSSSNIVNKNDGVYLVLSSTWPKSTNCLERVLETFSAKVPQRKMQNLELFFYFIMQWFVCHFSIFVHCTEYCWSDYNT